MGAEFVLFLMVVGIVLIVGYFFGPIVAVLTLIALILIGQIKMRI